MDRHLITKNNTDDIIQFLSLNYSLPTIKSCLVVYSTDNKYTFELIFRNNKPHFRFFNNINLDTSVEQDDRFDDFPYIELPEEKLKFFLKMISKFGFNKVNINESQRFEFFIDDTIKLIIQKNTLLGDIIYIPNDLNKKIINFISKKIDTNVLDRNVINKIIDNKKLKSELLYSKYGSINSKIHDFANKQGINLSFSPSTIALKLGSKSNDFKDLDSSFNLVTGKSLVGNSLIKNVDDRLLNGVSVIVSSFNSNKTILKVLESINSQKLKKDIFKKTEVIVVDDGSDIPVRDVIQTDINKYKFNLRIIRLEQNMGLSTARNSGVNLSSNENLIFIDSDILLTENYIKEALIRLQTIPNSMYFALKKNIEDEDIDIKKIKKGLKIPADYDDKRLSRYFSLDTHWINEITVSGSFEILGDTDNLKFFGNGRVMNGYDLPSAVVGHNLIIKKRTLQKVGGFSNHFSGWGLEDTFFGAKVISSGNFLIPILSTGVYHINHPPRSGSEKNRYKEYAQNLIKYKELINKQI